MMRLEAVVALFPGLDETEVSAWIEQRWVRPDTDDIHGFVFRDIDVARVGLIYDLRHDLETPDHAVAMVLSLVDQLYDHRRRLNAVIAALAAQPENVRAAVLGAMTQSNNPPP